MHSDLGSRGCEKERAFIEQDLESNDHETTNMEDDTKNETLGARDETQV